MKNLLILLAVIVTSLGCKKSNQSISNRFILQAAIEFSIQDTQNIDLLNPNNPNHIDPNKVRLFYLVNNEPKLFYEPNLDAPFGVRMNTERGNRIGISLNYSDQGDKSTTYIQWNENDRDTVEVSYHRHLSSVLMEKVWLNSKLIWEANREGVLLDPYYTIIKER